MFIPELSRKCWAINKLVSVQRYYHLTLILINSVVVYIHEENTHTDSPFNELHNEYHTAQGIIRSHTKTGNEGLH